MYQFSAATRVYVNVADHFDSNSEQNEIAVWLLGPCFSQCLKGRSCYGH